MSICLVCRSTLYCLCIFFFFNATPPSELYTLSLHDALPIYCRRHRPQPAAGGTGGVCAGDHRCRPDVMEPCGAAQVRGDRKSTRLNSSHVSISYAVFCLKKKTNVSTNMHMVA